MANQATNYQCPACSGPVHFDPKLSKMKCDYCESVYEVEEIETIYAEQAQKAAEAAKNTDSQKDENGWGENAQGMRVYNCPSCGAELITEETTAATNCPYCGNQTILAGQISDEKKPDMVIPFEYEKKDAKNALSDLYKGKFLLPKAFIDNNHIEEIKGVYVPFFLFDKEADCDLIFEATTSRTYQSGDYEVIETDHYEVQRQGKVSFSQIPADASTQMPDGHMDSIEPFDYTKIKTFSPSYLLGFLANQSDVEMEECEKRVDGRAKQSAIDVIQSDITNYDTVTHTGGTVNLSRKNVSYAMLPVWLLYTKWEGKDHLFAMNGQSGKMIGDLPIDKKKAALLFVGVFVITFLILSFVMR